MRTGLLRWKHNSFIRLRRSRKNYNIFCLSSVDESVGVLWQLCQHVMAINVQLSWHFPYKFCIFRFSAFDNVVAPTSIRAYETQTCFCILDISVHIYSSQSDNCTWWRWKKKLCFASQPFQSSKWTQIHKLDFPAIFSQSTTKFSTLRIYFARELRKSFKDCQAINPYW